MTNPTRLITNGPAHRDLEQAFIARRLGAKATFTIVLEEYVTLEVRLHVFNFAFVTCQHPNYEIGGRLTGLSTEDEAKLPRHNFVSLKYDADLKNGFMEFPNGE